MKSISSLSLNSLIITHPLNINPFYLYHHLHSIHTFNPLNINPFTIITYSIIPVIHISSFQFINTINTFTPTIIPILLTLITLLSHPFSTNTHFLIHPYSLFILNHFIPLFILSHNHHTISLQPLFQDTNSIFINNHIFYHPFNPIITLSLFTQYHQYSIHSHL